MSLHRVCGKLLSQTHMRFVCFGDHQQSAGFLVDSMNNPGSLCAADI